MTNTSYVGLVDLRFGDFMNQQPKFQAYSDAYVFMTDMRFESYRHRRVRMYDDTFRQNVCVKILHECRHVQCVCTNIAFGKLHYKQWFISRTQRTVLLLLSADRLRAYVHLALCISAVSVELWLLRPILCMVLAILYSSPPRAYSGYIKEKGLEKKGAPPFSS